MVLFVDASVQKAMVKAEVGSVEEDVAEDDAECEMEDEFVEGRKSSGEAVC